MTRQVLEMMWMGDFVLAGPLSLNLKAMAATAESHHLLRATPDDPLQVKVKGLAGLLLRVAWLRMTKKRKQQQVPRTNTEDSKYSK